MGGAMPPEQVKHLELIQAVITRMAGNSALLKGWSVTLSSALIGWAAASNAHIKYALLGLLPPIFFAVLDAFYLRQERLFRKLYDHVRRLSAANWQADPFTMDTRPFAATVNGWTRTIFAKVVLLPHLLVLLMVAGIVLLWLYILTGL
jgi:hypothetical protein